MASGPVTGRDREREHREVLHEGTPREVRDWWRCVPVTEAFAVADEREAEARAQALAEVRALRRPDPVFEDGRPNPNGYEGGWNDAIDEVLDNLSGEPR